MTRSRPRPRLLPCPTATTIACRQIQSCAIDLTSLIFLTGNKHVNRFPAFCGTEQFGAVFVARMATGYRMVGNWQIVQIQRNAYNASANPRTDRHNHCDKECFLDATQAALTSPACLAPNYFFKARRRRATAQSPIRAEPQSASVDGSGTRIRALT